MIVSFNFYYAKPGLAGAVLRQRLLACDVRRDLKLPRGRVLVREEGDADLPDVIWEQHFEDVNGHHADMEVRAASPEFEAVRAGMRQLCRRFERPLFESAVALDADAPGAITLDWLYGGPEVDERLVEILQDANTADAHALCLVTPETDLPRWIVKREGVERDSSDHRAWREAIAGAADRAEHSVWRVA